MKRWALIAALALAFLVGCGQRVGIDTGHVAGIACGADGYVHMTASNYNAGMRSVDGGPFQAFQGGFNLTLSGSSAHTLVVTADDWPTFSQTAGPCTQPTTTTSSPPTTIAVTTTTCVDCTINTVVITTPTTTIVPTTTTVPPTTTTCPDCTINTLGVPTTTTQPTPTTTQPTTTTSGPPGATTTTVPRTNPTTTTVPSTPPTLVSTE